MRDESAPTITKDGVTVAKEIELKDPLENMGAQMVKELVEDHVPPSRSECDLDRVGQAVHPAKNSAP
jgi:hypothetical protein